jgi:steroid delta-isomerase-like uncharacterized protein
MHREMKHAIQVPTMKGGRMAQSAEDTARESIECYNAGDFDRLRSLLADDFYEEELATQRRLEGADARVEAAQTWKRAFPDEHGTITGVYTSGNTLAIELTWEGTQSGPIATSDGQELPPSNKRIKVKSVQMIEIEDGKLKALRHYFDLMTLLKQIGAMGQADAAIASRLHGAASGG